MKRYWPKACFKIQLFLSIFFSFMRIYIQIRKYLRENNHEYENFTIALFCYQTDLNINTTELWIKEKIH